MNKDSDIQKILKSKYMKGPKYRMVADSIGINYFSGSNHSIFYELIGPTTVFRLIIIKPSKDLYMSNYVGKGYLLVFILEGKRMVGGLLSNNADCREQFKELFPQLDDEEVRELTVLWSNFVFQHYKELLNDED